MHSLFLSKWYPGRNDPQLGVFIQEQARAVKSFCQVSVIFAHPVKDQSQELLIDRNLQDGLLELRAYYRPDRSTSPMIRKLKNFLAYRKAMRKALAELVEERGYPDICHVHIMVRPVFTALRLKRTKGIPFIISEQSSEYLDGSWAGKNFLFKWFNRWAFRKASTITAVSTWLSQGMRELGIKGRYRVVPNVLPTDRHQVAEKGTAGHFLMVADLVDKTKNVSGVIRALATVRIDHPSARLDIIGDGNDRQVLEELVLNLDLSQSVRFLGRLPNKDVLEHMRKVGCVVINSRVETFSVVTGEALMLGKPVVATRCGGPAAFVNSENGILIPVDDPIALQNALSRIIESFDQYDPTAVRNTVGSTCSPEAVGQAFMNIYREALS